MRWMNIKTNEQKIKCSNIGMMLWMIWIIVEELKNIEIAAEHDHGMALGTLQFSSLFDLFCS